MKVPEIDLKYSLFRMSTTETQYLSAMLEACSKANFDHWSTIKPHAENEFRSLVQILYWLGEMKHQNKMTTEEARIHIDIQKNTMRTRLMTHVNMIEAEHIINMAVDSIRKDLYTRMDWVII